MKGSYDLGAALVIVSLLVIPAGLLRLSEVRVKHAALLWALGWLTGIAAVFARKRA